MAAQRRKGMNRQVSLADRLAGFVPEHPVGPPYRAPARPAFRSDPRTPAWTADDVAFGSRVAPAGAAPKPGRLVTHPAAGWQERQGARSAVLLASAILLVGAGAGAVVVVQHVGGRIGDASSRGVPAPVQDDPTQLQPGGIGGGSTPPTRVADLPSIRPVVAPPVNSTTTSRPRTAATGAPPGDAAVVAPPPPTLNPPLRPGTPAPPATPSSTTSTRPAPTTTSTTKPAATTTTTKRAPR